MSADAVPTSDEARDLNRLWNDAESYPHLIEVAKILPGEVKAQLRAAHDAEPETYCCNAHNEGQACCLDILLADPARYAPERVAEAVDLLRRYRESL